MAYKKEQQYIISQPAGNEIEIYISFSDDMGDVKCLFTNNAGTYPDTWLHELIRNEDGVEVFVR